jgi:hypothetical protein
MNPSLCLHVVEIVGFAILFFAPFSKSRIRAHWANAVFFGVSLVGFFRGIFLTLLDKHWVAVSQPMEGELYILGGVLIGAMLTLAISGQLAGAKQPKK